MDTIDTLVDDYLSDLFDEWPEGASALGLDGYDDRLSQHSREAYERRAASTSEWIRRFEAAEPAGVDEGIDRDLALSRLRGSAAIEQWRPWRRNPSLYLEPGLFGVFTLFLYRLRPEDELAEAALARLDAVPGILAEGIENIDRSLASPVFVRRARDLCTAAATYVRDIVPGEVTDPAARERLAEAGARAARACDEFGEFLEKLEPDAGGSYAVGDDLYSTLLADKEMLGYGAREMRERGREEFERIAADMRARARALRGTDDWLSVVVELNRDHPETPEAMRDAYEEWTERARAFLIARKLVTLPEGERCLVEPSPPFQRPILAVASYNAPPAFKPSRTGHFFVPYPPEGTPPPEVAKRLESNSFMSIPTVSVHEAYPGHHWHLVTARENPRRLRRIIVSSYFAEGWALYAERMMLEEGFYDDPRHELGVAEARIFRAARIVVDTSLHVGDMSFDEAVAFLGERIGMAEPTARAEVGRYCTWPTQASSYLTGALEIERMRDAWVSRGGSLRDFHDRIAGSGSLPIALAERVVT